MDQENVKKAILDCVRKKDHVSYVEIEEIFRKCSFDYEGDLELCSAICSEVIFWSGWNIISHAIP